MAVPVYQFSCLALNEQSWYLLLQYWSVMTSRAVSAEKKPVPAPSTQRQDALAPSLYCPCFPYRTGLGWVVKPETDGHVVTCTTAIVGTSSIVCTFFHHSQAKLEDATSPKESGSSKENIISHPFHWPALSEQTGLGATVRILVCHPDFYGRNSGHG